jgi:hypothetical protein
MDDDLTPLLQFRLVPARVEPDPLPVAPHEELMTPGEVAALFGVDPQTVHEWTRRRGSRLAKLVVWTAGGHARYPRPKVEALREELYATD